MIVRLALFIFCTSFNSSLLPASYLPDSAPKTPLKFNTQLPAAPRQHPPEYTLGGTIAFEVGGQQLYLTIGGLKAAPYNSSDETYFIHDNGGNLLWRESRKDIFPMTTLAFFEAPNKIILTHAPTAGAGQSPFIDKPKCPEIEHILIEIRVVPKLSIKLTEFREPSEN